MSTPARSHRPNPTPAAAVTIDDIGGPVGSLHEAIAARLAPAAVGWPVVAARSLPFEERLIEAVSRTAGPMALIGAVLAIGYALLA